MEKNKYKEIFDSIFFKTVEYYINHKMLEF